MHYLKCIFYPYLFYVCILFGYLFSLDLYSRRETLQVLGRGLVIAASPLNSYDSLLEFE